MEFGEDGGLHQARIEKKQSCSKRIRTRCIRIQLIDAYFADISRVTLLAAGSAEGDVSVSFYDIYKQSLPHRNF